MQLILSASNALNKWLNADLPRLPHKQGKQAGVSRLQSDATQTSWQLHIIDNAYQSNHKTIIACEAYSRFTLFIAADSRLTLEELNAQLTMQWQLVLVEMLETQLMPRSDIALLLSQLETLPFTCEWVKNCDLSINGHISDASLWLTQTLQEHHLNRLPEDLSLDLSCYLNRQVKRIKSRKEKFIPIERLLTYCQQIIKENNGETQLPNNVLRLQDYR